MHSGLDEPTFRFFADLQVEVATPLHIGATTNGQRRLVAINGGTARGEGWQARVLPGGTDYQRIVNERLAELDARYVLETDAGDLIYVQNRALRSGPPEAMARLARGEPVAPELIYFRCSPRFETAAPSLAWLAERLFFGSGVREPDRVLMRFFVLG